MKIYLPHLHYTIHVKQIPKRPLIENAKAYVQSHGKLACTIFLDRKAKRMDPADLAHELIHVLQFICLERNIDFTLEQEHMGYIMHFLMGKIMGREYSDK